MKKLQVNITLVLFLASLFIWILRMVIPGIKYLFISFFVLHFVVFFILNRKVVFNKSIIYEFIKTITPLLLLGLFYIIGILNTEKIILYSLKDIGEFCVNLFLLFVFFVLMHNSPYEKGFKYIFKKISVLFGVTAVVISIIGISKFFFQLFGYQLPFNSPFGSAFNNDKNFYALYSFLGLMSFYSYVSRSNSFIKQLYYQFFILLIITNILLSFSFRSFIFLGFISVGLLFIQTYRLVSSDSLLFNKLASNLWLISIVLLVFFTVNVTIFFVDDDYSNNLFRYYNIDNQFENENDVNKELVLNSFNFEKWNYAIVIFKDQSFINKLFGSGFFYLEEYGLQFNDSKPYNYPHNPILSALLYSGIVGALFILTFMIISLYYGIIYLKKYSLFSLMLFVSSVFIFFSGNSIFSVPIFLFFFSLSFIIRHIEITDLKIDINLNKPGSRLLKEVFDYTVATVFILIFSPIYLIVSLVILFSMGWPVIYNQSRVGQNGKVFMLHKFRTMKNVKTNTSVAASEKFRITKVGSFLRKTKIDELPELWNIMRSDMSFVGPRPDVPGYADKLKDSDRVILQLKPGLTGPASLKYIDEDEILSTKDNPKKYNDEVIFPDKVKINKAYMRYWTFILDIKIIIFTVLRKSLKEDYFK